MNFGVLNMLKLLTETQFGAGITKHLIENYLQYGTGSHGDIVGYMNDFLNEDMYGAHFQRAYQEICAEKGLDMILLTNRAQINSTVLREKQRIAYYGESDLVVYFTQSADVTNLFSDKLMSYLLG